MFEYEVGSEWGMSTKDKEARLRWKGTPKPVFKIRGQSVQRTSQHNTSQREEALKNGLEDWRAIDVKHSLRRNRPVAA